MKLHHMRKLVIHESVREYLGMVLQNTKESHKVCRLFQLRLWESKRCDVAMSSFSFWTRLNANATLHLDQDELVQD